MAFNSEIEWTDASWNPVTGCTPISPGCANCYAKKMALRLAGRYGYPKENGGFTPGNFRKDCLDDPLAWKKPKRIFVCSMGDLFHEDVPEWQIDQVFERVLYDGISHHTFQILTKRPERMLAYCSQDHIGPILERAGNVWLGITAENQDQFEQRMLYLSELRAPVRYVSVEPMLESISTYNYRTDIDWIICGGETGPGARLMRPEWAQDLKEQCREDGIPFFMKQMSKKAAIPPYLQCREFPGK